MIGMKITQRKIKKVINTKGLEAGEKIRKRKRLRKKN
jgi:hypothetical protein